MISENFYCQTDIGKVRSNNEDNVYASKNKFGDIILLLLDGMGGHKKGDVASKLALDFISKRFLSRKGPFKNQFTMRMWFLATIKGANEYLHSIAIKSEDTKGMGTTVVGVLISGSRTLFINVGDSRGYIVANKKLKQITDDETYVNFLYKSGKIKKEEMVNHSKRNVLMNALGVYPSASVTPTFIKEPYEMILLCSDGLYTMIDDNMIIEVLNENGDLQSKCGRLIDLANENGGKDNIGVLIYEVIK